MTVLGIVLFLLWGAAILLTGVGTLISILRLNFGWSGTRSLHDHPLQPISILKPLKGCDAGLKENLEGFFNLDFPQYEILFSLQEKSDPAYPVVLELCLKYPQISTQIFINNINAGPNPKVNNLIKSYEMAAYDLVLISDSNVRVEPDYLRTLSSHLGVDVGMVTAAIAGRDESGLGGGLEAMYLNTFYARWMSLLFLIGRPCVIGKCMLFSRKTAQRFGGIQTLSRYLAEDYMAGEAIRRLGLKVVLAQQPLRQYIGNYSLCSFWSRHIRWGRIRKSQVLLAFLAEPLFCSVPSAVMGMAAFWLLQGVNPVHFLICHFSCWFVCDLPLLVQFGGKFHLRNLFIWCVRELSAFPLWVHIALGNSVQWRGECYQLEGGGLLKKSA